ncbi:ParB/RepB/Spo0J family partition protein [Conexibacter sp. W3-3-2]|nr:ParB/RepB/Spo0J family partition protein [Conexibacter sp. W3-3-2]
MSPQQNSQTVPVEQALVAIADVHRADGFNPRTDVVRDDDFTRLVLTIQERGVLQPIRVTVHPHGGYELLAGDRRLTAAQEAGLTEIPAVIVTQAQDEEDRLEDALIENELRVDLNPLERAKAYRRLRQGGRSVKAIALRFGRSQAYVRQHLQLLDLPVDLHEQFADGSIPLGAVAGLRTLAKASTAAAAALVREVMESKDGPEPWPWDEALARPAEVLAEADELPAGIYATPGLVLLEGLDLDAKTVKQLDQLEKLTGSRPTGVNLSLGSFAAAQALNATLGSEHRGLILGADVMAQLVGDVIAAALKQRKEQHKRSTELAEQAAARGGRRRHARLRAGRGRPRGGGGRAQGAGRCRACAAAGRARGGLRVQRSARPGDRGQAVPREAGRRRHARPVHDRPRRRPRRPRPARRPLRLPRLGDRGGHEGRQAQADLPAQQRRRRREGPRVPRRREDPRRARRAVHRPGRDGVVRRRARGRAEQPVVQERAAGRAAVGRRGPGDPRALRPRRTPGR